MSIDLITKNAVEEYQCPGCVTGNDISCYKKGENIECSKHCAGTHGSGIGWLFLGMPKGFNHLGTCDQTKIHIFKTLEDGWGYDKFNIPAWKYLDKHENTITRGLCPRINYPWIHIFLENCLNRIDCLEITQKDLDEMD